MKPTKEEFLSKIQQEIEANKRREAKRREQADRLYRSYRSERSRMYIGYSQGRR